MHDVHWLAKKKKVIEPYITVTTVSPTRAKKKKKKKKNKGKNAKHPIQTQPNFYMIWALIIYLAKNNKKQKLVMLVKLQGN